MDALGLLLKYLYSIQRKAVITKAEIYNDFFNAPFVKSYLDKNGLESPTEEVIKRRIPFLINILEAVGIVSQSTSSIEVLEFVPTKESFRLDPKENDDIVNNRIGRFLLHDKVRGILSKDETLKLKETFGSTFLTPEFYLNKK